MSLFLALKIPGIWQQAHRAAKQDVVAERARHDPGALWHVGQGAHTPGSAAHPLQLAQHCCQQRAFACRRMHRPFASSCVSEQPEHAPSMLKASATCHVMMWIQF